jgi:hypothetical protein
VGSCGKGTKKIMYTQGLVATNVTPAAAVPATQATAPAKKTAEPILTECKDGTVSVGGSCKK